MPGRQRLRLADIERETERFLAPGTEKERAILAATIDLLGERGVDGATTAEIANRAGVTERTLFRYFPSKRDLVRRVLAPTMLRTILTREWKPFRALLDASPLPGRGNGPSFISGRFSRLPASPALARALFGELTRNAELRHDLARLWYRHFWKPMLATVSELKGTGALRKDVDLEALVWAIDCLNIGYLFLRNVHAGDRKWDEAKELEKMEDILLYGSAGAPRRVKARPQTIAVQARSGRSLRGAGRTRNRL